MRRQNQDRHRTRSRRSGAGILLLLILVAALCLNGESTLLADPGTDIPLEYQLKAAFLYKFIKFVEWPESVLSDGDRSVSIGILGQSPMANAVAQFDSKEVVGRRLVVRQFETLENLEFCHVLFVPREEEENIDRILGTSVGEPTLLVSEVEGFAETGGMVNFIIIDNKIGFEINPDAAQAEDLKISSKLLRLARIVKERE